MRKIYDKKLTLFAYGLMKFQWFWNKTKNYAMHIFHFQNCAFFTRPKASIFDKYLKLANFSGYLIDRIFIIILCFILFLLMIAQQLAFHYFVNYNQRKLSLLNQRHSWNRFYTLSSKFQLVANLAVLKVINLNISKDIIYSNFFRSWE